MNKKIVVIAGPSGSGKNTLIRKLKERYPRIDTLVTATTRMVRPGEEEGRDYFFMPIERFDEETARGNIAGTRFVPLFGGVHYGIFLPDLKKKIDTASVLFAPVDLTGARWLKENYGALTIFIMPESFEAYRSRVHARSPEMSEREFSMRMKIAEDECRTHAPQYDYRVVNADGALQETVEQVIEILKKEGYTL
ncbi:MAG: guanylate kinase [Candidatus Kaiserbacteria bacterium]|nr:guanylate kinase [Candidatus Kaiserbacteria bacterium]